MSFLTPQLLAAFGALLVPIVIHLWQRKKVIRMPFSTLRFLNIVKARTSRSSIIENLLLLLLRCLVVGLIIFAACRPVLSSRDAQLLGGSVPRTIALVIDQSLSMGYRSGDDTRLALAKRQANAVIDDLKPGDAIALIAASDRANLLIAEPTVDHVAARKAIDGIQLTEGRSDFSPSLREARKAVAKALRGTKQIFLFSDDQESGWQFEKAAVFDESWEKTGARLIVVRSDDLPSVNATITKMKFESPFAANGLVARASATVDNHSAAPLRDLLELKIDGEKIISRAAEPAAGSSVEVPLEFQTPLLKGRWMLGSVNLAGDRLMSDDTFYFVQPVYQTPRVLIVESANGPERARPGFFLRRALEAGAGGAPIKTVATSELDELPLEPFSAVFLAGVPDVSDRASVRIDRYLEAGGTVVFFPSDQSDLVALSRLEWLPAKLTKTRELPAGRLVARPLEPQHPLFTNSWDANTPFPALPQRKLVEVTLRSEGRTLLTLGDLPFILYGERGTGRVIMVNASPDRAWGDFPLTAAFLPLVQQIGRLSLARTGRESAHLVGEPVPAPLSLPRDQALSVKTPHGETVPVQAGGPLLERAEQAGFYEVSSTAEGVLHQFAVNVDPRESDLRAMDDAELSKMVPHELLAGTEALNLWLAQKRGLVPLWPVLLVLALLVFAGEGIYSNILARRRSQGNDTQIATGRLNKRRLGQVHRAAAEPEPQTEEATA